MPGSTGRAVPLPHGKHQRLKLIRNWNKSLNWQKTCPQPRLFRSDAALHSNCRRNSTNPISAMQRAKCRLFAMPRTFKSSMPMMPNRWARLVASLRSASSRTAAILAWSSASLFLALRRLAAPFILRDRLRECLRKRTSNSLRGFGPGTFSPVESDASPALVFGFWKTNIRRINGNADSIRTQPRLGIRIPRPATLNWSFEMEKRSWTPFFLNFG